MTREELVHSLLGLAGLAAARAKPTSLATDQLCWHADCGWLLRRRCLAGHQSRKSTVPQGRNKTNVEPGVKSQRYNSKLSRGITVDLKESEVKLKKQIILHKVD